MYSTRQSPRSSCASDRSPTQSTAPSAFNSRRRASASHHLSAHESLLPKASALVSQHEFLKASIRQQASVWEQGRARARVRACAHLQPHRSPTTASPPAAPPASHRVRTGMRVLPSRRAELPRRLWRAGLRHCHQAPLGRRCGCAARTRTCSVGCTLGGTRRSQQTCGSSASVDRRLRCALPQPPAPPSPPTHPCTARAGPATPGAVCSCLAAARREP